MHEVHATYVHGPKIDKVLPVLERFVECVSEDLVKTNSRFDIDKFNKEVINRLHDMWSDEDAKEENEG